MPSHSSFSPVLSFDVTVGIWLRKVVFCHNFILRAAASFWVVSLVGVNPDKASTQNECITSGRSKSRKLKFYRMILGKVSQKVEKLAYKKYNSLFFFSLDLLQNLLSFPLFIERLKG